MKKLMLMAALAAFTAWGSAAAQAAPGVSTADVNLRSGPDTEYPSAGVIPEGSPIEVEGCLSDESWCDVVWSGNRGWVFSEYIAFDQRGEYVPLPDVGIAAFHIPVVRFIANDYWGRYYVSRPWYADRARWIKFAPRPRPGWHAPPPGVRARGWWRSGYRAPEGMRPPPERDWRRPDRR